MSLPCISDACNLAALLTVRQGVNFFDTAHTYTGDEAERLLGLFSRQDRERLKITTKASYTGDSGRKNILRQFDESRARMDLDMIDILLFASPVS